MQRHLAIVLLTSSICALPALAKEKTLKFESEWCTNSVRYDPEIHQSKAIEATYNFVEMTAGIDFPRPPMISDPEDLTKIDVAKYQGECERAIKQAQSLDLVDLPSVLELQKARIDEIRDTCTFEIAQMRGYRDPSALRAYQPSEALCSRHIDALEGKADIRAHFHEIVRENCKINGDPKGCRDRSLAYEKRPDAEAKIRIEVLKFGWVNCSTGSTKANTTNFDKLKEKVMADYKRTFKLKQKCDSAD